jgi:hypothetical protein
MIMYKNVNNSWIQKYLYEKTSNEIIPTTEILTLFPKQIYSFKENKDWEKLIKPFDYWEDRNYHIDSIDISNHCDIIAFNIPSIYEDTSSGMVYVYKLLNNEWIKVKFLDL